jgi:hypothetical protein
MQLVVVKAKGNSKKLGHSALPWSKKIQNFHGIVLFDLHRISFEPKSKAITIHKSGCFFKAPNEGWCSKKGGKTKGKDKDADNS